MSTSQLYAHSVPAYLQRFILGHMLDPFARSPKLSQHNCPPSSLHWIMSPRVRYSTIPTIGNCWLGVRLPRIWLSRKRGVGFGLCQAGSSSWLKGPIIMLCCSLEYPRTILRSLCILRWSWMILTIWQAPSMVLSLRKPSTSLGSCSPHYEWLPCEWG